jgi:hypothetical protein
LKVPAQLGSFFLPVGLAFGLLAAAGCSGTPSVPEQPTWADVEPILRGECSQCHGSTAQQTGLGYRLDFFDMTAEVCGAAALALPPPTARPTPGPVLAGAAADLIYQDIEPTAGGGPPKMPPQPGPLLLDWEREMLENWTDQPSKGPAPAGNRLPTIQANGIPSTVDKDLQFLVVLGDPDGDDVVGVIQVAGVTFAMNRTGSFAVDLDTSSWPNGVQQLTAVLCDGWANVSVPLGPVAVVH